MKTTWKYQPLFAFNIVHPVLQNTSFTLEPSRSCYAQLKQAGFLYKHIENGNIIMTEKQLLPDGSKKVINRITKPVVFSFLLKCNDLERFNQTTDALQGSLPSFSGRSRVFYFDNMDAGGVLDSELEYPAQTTLVDYDFAVMPLSSNEQVSVHDLSSIFPNRLKINMDTLAQLRLAKISPGNSSANTYMPDESSQVQIINLPDAAYRLTKVHTDTGPATELIVVGDDFLKNDIVGVIHIFKDADVDYGKLIRYDILF